tara:strand:- start:1409 stop:2347 length:939 start_codon:yes stop_codon:yes gene_type:complete
MNNIKDTAKSKILVTGGTGFVGRRLLMLLSSLDHQVWVVSRKTDPNLATILCDLEKKNIPSNALDLVDTVFHLAGYAHDLRDAETVKHRYKALNVDATVELATLAVNSGVKRFVFLSSVKAGGNAGSDTSASENTHHDPEGIYGESKRQAELKLLEIGKNSDMHVVIIRSSLVYGPDVKGNLKQMLSGIRMGWFPPLPETGNKRSMIHVDDLVKAIVLVSQDERANGEIYTLTDGHPYSSREIHDVMCAVLGRKVPIWRVPKCIFSLFSLITPNIKFKINKLLGDEYYSSKKIEALGFKAQKGLKDMNETDF